MAKLSDSVATLHFRGPAAYNAGTRLVLFPAAFTVFWYLLRCSTLDTRWSLIVLGFIAVKLVFENVLYPATGVNPLIGGAVITQSHWLGALTGLVAGILLLFRTSSQRAVRE